MVEVFTSAAFRDGKGAVGIAIRASGRTVRVIGRAVRAASRTEAAYRALLHGLWRARKAGVRQVQAYADTADVVEQLAGGVDVPSELTGLYLQVRALLNAYRWTRIEYIAREHNAEAALAAAALDQDLIAPDLDPEEDASPSLFPTQLVTL